jgi:hypothetical protein
MRGKRSGYSVGMLSNPFKFATSVLAAVMAATTCAAAQQTAPAPAAEKPAPDVLVFTNGDQLTGKLERGVAGTVVFKSDMAGEITVPLDKVKELHVSGSYALLRSNVPVSKTPVQPGTVAYENGNLTVSRSSAPAEVVPSKEVGYLIDEPTYEHELGHGVGFFKEWNGSINGGATLVRSTTEVNTYTAGIALIRSIPTVPYLPARNRTTFNLQETYGKQSSPGFLSGVILPVITKTNIFHADAERDQYFSPRAYALAQTSFDHNYSQGLSLQAVYGVGVGWTALKSAKQELDLKVDIHYETQQFQTNDAIIIDPLSQPTTQKLIGSTFTETYTRNLPHKLVFTEFGNVLPAWNNMNAYSANGGAGIAMPVFKKLSVQFQTTDNFLNDPPPLYKKNSYQFVTGVVYNLR